VNSQKMRKVGPILGVISAVLLFTPLIPLGDAHVSLSEAHGLCSSGLGQFASLISLSIAHDCSEVNLFFTLCWVALVAGAGMLIYGLMLERRG
jgi:hypothetical protein